MAWKRDWLNVENMPGAARHVVFHRSSNQVI
jgi:hypothetical protein